MLTLRKPETYTRITSTDIGSRNGTGSGKARCVDGDAEADDGAAGEGGPLRSSVLFAAAIAVCLLFTGSAR